MKNSSSNQILYEKAITNIYGLLRRELRIINYMLDYFLLKGYFALDEYGDIITLEACPSNLRFEENRDGNIVFIARRQDGKEVGISDIEDWEFLDIEQKFDEKTHFGF